MQKSITLYLQASLNHLTHSDHNLYHYLAFQNPEFYPQTIMDFARFSEQIVMISPKNINWLVFLIEWQCLLWNRDWFFKYYLD